MSRMSLLIVIFMITPQAMDLRKRSGRLALLLSAYSHSPTPVAAVTRANMQFE